MRIFKLKSALILITISFLQIAHAQKKSVDYVDLDSILLQSVFDTTDILRKVATIDKSDLKKKRHVRVVLNKKNMQIEGKLLAYSKYGLFIYEKNGTLFNLAQSKIGFYPFKKIRKVKLGRSYFHFVRVTSAIVAGVTTLIILPQDADIALPWGIIAGLAYATYGQIFVGPIYGISKAINHLNWKLSTKDKSINLFYQYLKDRPFEIKNVMEFNGKASIINENSLKMDSTWLIVNNQTKSDTVSNSSQSLNIEKKSFLKGLVFGDDNNLRAKWIFQDFNPSKVKEIELLSVFKNIRGMQISREQLTKYNTSQLQFLVMMICSGGGYNMKSAANLTEKQKSFIKTYESGYLEDVQIEGTISTMNLSDIDLENLKVIYGELSERTQ